PEQPPRDLAAVLGGNGAVVGVEHGRIRAEDGHIAIQEMAGVGGQGRASEIAGRELAVARGQLDQLGDAVGIHLRLRQPARDLGARQRRRARLVVLAPRHVHRIVVEHGQAHCPGLEPARAFGNRLVMAQDVADVAEVVVGARRPRIGALQRMQHAVGQAGGPVQACHGRTTSAAPTTTSRAPATRAMSTGRCAPSTPKWSSAIAPRTCPSTIRQNSAPAPSLGTSTVAASTMLAPITPPAQIHAGNEDSGCGGSSGVRVATSTLPSRQVPTRNETNDAYSAPWVSAPKRALISACSGSTLPTATAMVMPRRVQVFTRGPACGVADSLFPPSRRGS